MPVSDTTREAAEALVKRYPVARSALLPLLHLVQADHGYVSDEGIAFCAESLGLTKAEVGAVATFYTMFKRQPVGDYLLSVCTNPTCKIAGAQDIYEGYVEQLGGHSSAEDGVTVEHAECLGICDAAPVVQVNYEMFGPVTKEQADDLLAACRKGSPPASNWSNEVPRTFAEVEFELSGATDGVNDLLAVAARAQVEAEVPPTYRSGETDIPVTHPGGDPKGVGGEVLRERIAGVAAAETEPALSGATEAVRTGFGGDVPVGPAAAGGGEHQDLGTERERAEDAPHVAEEADIEETAASEDVAGEGRGVAEERSDQTGAPTPQPPAADETPEAPPAGEMPVEAAGDAPTATEQTQVGRKVGGGAEAEPSTHAADDSDDEAAPQTVQGGPQTRTDEAQREADERADSDPIRDEGGAEDVAAGTEPATDASQSAAADADLAQDDREA